VPFGPYFSSLPVDGGGKRYVDGTSWDAVIDNFVNWKDNVNGGGFTLSNVVISSASIANAGTLSIAATGANRIDLSTNGALRMRITSAGAVQIGAPTLGNLVAISSVLNNGISLEEVGGAGQQAIFFVSTAGGPVIGTVSNHPLIVYANNAAVGFFTENGRFGVQKAAPGSAMAVVGLPTHADNTAAVGAGLTAGDFYKTAAGAVMVAF